MSDIKKGDTVSILQGSFRGSIGVVEGVYLGVATVKLMYGKICGPAHLIDSMHLRKVNLEKQENNKEK